MNGLRVKKFLDQALTETEALSKTYKLIVKLTRQGTQAFRGDANKVEYLRNTVIRSHWAKNPLSRVGTMRLTFQQLHAELAASLQLANDTSRAEKIDLPRRKSEDHLADVYYTGQGRYSRAQAFYYLHNCYANLTILLQYGAVPHWASATAK